VAPRARADDPQRRQQGFDALSVRDPAIVTRGTKIELLYAGSDGAGELIGYAHREATNHLPLGP